jgi:PIN domain nuclease of toxin-antitoxin system
VNRFDESLLELGFLDLPITIDHAQRAGLLPGNHKDPFDRLLIAQAQAENLVLISNERLFDDYGIRRLW